MIAEYLNRGVVLDQLREVCDDLRSQLRRLAAQGGTPRLDDVQLLEDLEAVESRETRRSSGQKGFEPTAAARRGQEAAPLDDYAFFSRDPIVSLLQSALDEHSAVIHPEELENMPPLDDDRRGPEDDIAVSDQHLKNAPAFRRSVDGRRFLDKFSITDIGWVRSKLAEGIRFFRQKRAFNEHPAQPCEMPARARVVLVGDWATGLPRAQKVAVEMRKVIEQGRAGGLVQHIVHLGDVYYSGWGHEYRRRFLPYWPVRPAEADAIGSWCLNGNHDMYSGGHAYYDILLADARFKHQARSSFFSLVNSHWKIIGLDTAWEEATLRDPQASWLEAEIVNERRNIVILSHHQLFSAYESGASGFLAAAHPLLERRPIKACFWGHEHRCVLYGAFANVEFGRCIGHGGVPAYMWHGEHDPYPTPAVYEYRKYIQKGLERWALFGFAVLDFDGPSLDVRYIDENGRVHKSESLA